MSVSKNTGSGASRGNSSFRASISFRAMLKLGAILALYAAAACVGLAFVHAGTEKVIAGRQQADLEAALKELFPDADSFRPISHIASLDPAVTIDTAGSYGAIKNGTVVGAALRVSRAGYNGALRILVGVEAGGRICGVKILDHSETPGLGANAASASYYVDRAGGIRFYEQFTGKNARDPFVIRQDVIAITAATITSRAVAGAVKAAGEAATAWLDSNPGFQGESR